MSYTPTTTIKNNLILSIIIHRGAFFQNPSLGSRLHTLTKITADTLQLAEAYIKEAVQWILDTGRATRIGVEVTRDPGDLHRIKIRIEAVQADGREISFVIFYGVA